MKLKKCPCCGNKNIVSGVYGNGWGNSFVACMNNECGLTVEGDAPCAGKFTKNLAEKRWNKRTK